MRLSLACSGPAGRRRPRRGTARLFVLHAAVAASAAAGFTSAPAYARPAQAGPATPAPRLAFNIAAGTVGTTADAFAAVTGMRVTLADMIRDLPAPGVRGTFTPQQALDRMLAGTGVGFSFTGVQTVTLDLRTAEFVAVEAPHQAVVSSPKFTEALVDTPQSIAVIPNEIFNQQGAQNLTEVLRNTPGITFNAGENGFASGPSNFSMRGFDTTGSIFIDGARDSGNYLRDVFNIEQVEVVKGPAGDNGRGSAGGYVNLATKSPLAASFRRGSLGYGLDGHDGAGRTRATVDLNQRVGEGTAVRLNALWQDGGVPGREVARKDTWGFAPSAAFGLDQLTRVVLSYQHVEQHDLPDWGVPGALVEGMNAFSAAAGSDANRSRFYGHASDYDDVTSDAVIARVDHDFIPGVRLSNQTRWSRTDREALYAIPTGYAAATRLVTTQRQAYARQNTSISNLTNFSAPVDTGGFDHTISAGIEISRERSDADRFPTNGVLGNPGSIPIDDPDPGRPLAGLVGLIPLQTADVRIDTLAAYAYDTVQLTPRWQISGGLRLERYNVELASRSAAGAPQGPDGYDRSDSTVSGKAGVVFKPTVSGSLYAAIGVATLPPASYLSNPDISRDGDNSFPGWSAGPNSAAANVQRSTNYEAGVKWELLDERLGASAAVFRTNRRNVAMAGTVNGVANTFAGYGRQVVQGVELGVTGSITPAWSVFGGLLLMDSERRHDAAVDAARRAANPADYGTASTTNGDELAFSPNTSATLWTTYLLPSGVTIGGGLQQRGESFLGRPDDAERIVANGVFGVLPGYTVVNALAAYTVNPRLTLRLNIDNLTNELHAASSNWAGTRVSLGPARAFLISADVGF